MDAAVVWWSVCMCVSGTGRGHGDHRAGSERGDTVVDVPAASDAALPLRGCRHDPDTWRGQAGC